MTDVCCYVAYGFKLNGDELTFAPPSANLPAQSVLLRSDERREIREALLSSRRTSICNGMIAVSLEGRMMRWEIYHGDGSEIQVFVTPPLSTVLFKSLGGD